VNDLFARRAARLAMLYPRSWRKRFPDFVEVLSLELAHHPWRAASDVVRGASTERLRSLGLVPHTRAERARSGLALTYAALIPFAGLVAGMWSQLHTGLATQGLEAAPILWTVDLLLGVGTVVAVVSFVIAIALVATQAGRLRLIRNASGTSALWLVVRPAVAFMGAMAALSVAGWTADRSGWYSPAAAALPHRGAAHVATLWVRGVIATMTPAWIHPSLLARMPTGELAATFVTPAAILVAGVSIIRLMILLPIRCSGKALAVLAVGTAGTMVLAFAASVRWILVHPTREGTTRLLAQGDQIAPGHTGWGVVLLLGALAFAALLGARRVLQGRDRRAKPEARRQFLPPQVGTGIDDADNGGRVSPMIADL
jgi:hypothetical protein